MTDTARDVLSPLAARWMPAGRLPAARLPVQAVSSSRLTRFAGILEDVVLLIAVAYALPLAILLVTTPIGLLIHLVIAIVARL